MAFAPGCFSSPYLRPTFSAIFPWSPYYKFQKMRDLGVFAKFPITRICRHFWSRGLKQNVVPRLHFKSILICRWKHLRRAAFQPRKFGLLFQPFSPCPPNEKSQKMRDFGVFAKFPITRFCRHFWSRGWQQNVVPWLHFKTILIRRWWYFGPGCFLSP